MTPRINAIRLNKEENPWKLPGTGKLISPPGTPNIEQQTSRGEDLDDLLAKELPLQHKPLKDIYKGISNLRFGSDREENPFQSTNRVLVLPTFLT